MSCGFCQICMGKSLPDRQHATKITISVNVGEVQATALVDSGCGHTLIRQGLIPTFNFGIGEICFQCIHRDVKPYLSARIPLMVNGVTRVMIIRLAPRLVYTVTLGWDLQGFTGVLCALGCPLTDGPRGRPP